MDKRKPSMEEAWAIRALSTRNLEALRFTARILIQAAFPHRPVSGTEWTRSNGTLSVNMIALAEVGLPYGSYPRLIMTWLTTEAVRNCARKSGEEQRHIWPGNTLSHFMAELGLTPTGGKTGTIGRLREQMDRLFSMTILSRNVGDRKGSGLRYAHIKPRVLVDEATLWWDPHRPNHGLKWRSSIVLSQSFFDLITERPVPVDIDVLRLIKKSPLALDIYSWATYRVSYLKRPTLIPWSALLTQLGAGYADTSQGRRNFRRKFTTSLKHVHSAWPGLRAEVQDAGLRLRPCLTHVPRRTPVDNPVNL